MYRISTETAETKGFGLNSKQLQEAGVDAFRMNRIGRQLVDARVSAKDIKIEVYFHDHENNEVIVDPNHLEALGLGDLQEIEIVRK